MDDFDFDKLPAFEKWCALYVEFKTKHLGFLAHPLPTDIAGKGGIEDEYFKLPGLYSRAGRYESLASFYYYRAKSEGWLNAVLGRITDDKGEPLGPQPKSSCLDIAKARCYKEILMREDTKKIREDLRNRGFKIEQLKKQWETPINGA